MKRKISLSLLVFLGLITVYHYPSFSQLSQNDLAVSWEVLENNYKDKPEFLSVFTFTNLSSSRTISDNWSLYFNFPRMVGSNSIEGGASIKHINGDFFELSPNSKFFLKPGDSTKIFFVSNAWAQNQTDAPSGIYIVFKDSLSGKEKEPALITHYTVKPFSWKALSFRYSKDNPGFITPEGSYTEFSKVVSLPENQLLPLIPVPKEYHYGNNTIKIDPSYSVIASTQLKDEQQYLIKTLNDLLIRPLTSKGKNKIVLSLSEIQLNGKVLKRGDEAYQLIVGPGKIEIKGTDQAGVFYGIQSLKALLPPMSFKTKNDFLPIKEITITDFPGFHYRGLELDVARNFQNKEAVMKLLELASFYKLNKFHFHLTDDEGWRIEIKSLPELTAVGSKRDHATEPNGIVPSFASGPFEESSSGSGFYTRKDFIEILQFAHQRHIEVIPELDLPGHSRAAIKSMDVRYSKLMREGKKAEAEEFLLRDTLDQSKYLSVQMWNDNVVCPCQESTYNFVKAVVAEFVDMYKEAGVPLTMLHTGGDEVPNGVWEKSPACQSLMSKDPSIANLAEVSTYFLSRIDLILNQFNLKTAGWEEIALKKAKSENATSSHVVNPDFMDKDFIPYVWNNINGAEDLAYKLANAGYPVILSAVTNLYFDMAYNANPMEIGYYWGGFVDTRKVFEFSPMNVYMGMFKDKRGMPIDQKDLLQTKEQLTEKGKENILGIQGLLWSENITSIDRQQYMIFPKLIALSQVAWTKNPSWSLQHDQSSRLLEFEQAYTAFANTLGKKELVRLDYMNGGVNYRIAPPGADIDQGILKANVEFPGFVIRYTTDGSEPNMKSPVYNGPVGVKGTVKLKAFASNGRSSRTVLVQE